jgi:uncharacterized protein (UPF0332 family)
VASPELIEHVRAAFAKSGRKLAAAGRDLAAGDADEAVGRAYYAAYHAVEAALQVEGLQARTHEGLKMLFGRTFVEAGLVARDLGRALARLKDDRESGDYALYTGLELADAEASIRDANRIVDAMREFVRSRGVDPQEPPVGGDAPSG